MKKILGLDLGTNSIGWAVVSTDNNNKPNGIEKAGSRIIPMDLATMSDFEKGNTKSQTAERTRYRGVRRLRERSLLRRERLHRVLNIIGFLPEHYAEKIGWNRDDNKTYGKFIDYSEPKLQWKEIDNGDFDFLFKSSYNEMLSDFTKHQPLLLSDDKKVPYDWTIYYLRKKALTEKISKEELAWVLLNFNKKRGYYQLREEDEEKKDKLEEYYSLKVVDVEQTGEIKGNESWYNVVLENGFIYRRKSNTPLNWVGKTKDFIVTTDLDSNGNPKLDKDGNVKRSFRAPKEEDWALTKIKTEQEVEKSNKTVGAYIYDSILCNPDQKIIGKLVRVIERKFYESELDLILDRQKEFHQEFQDKELYKACLNELYKNNVSYRESILKRDLAYLIKDDIIFYHRPLKSKKSLISNCPFEERSFVDEKTGEVKISPIKCIAKSHPLYQEFRLWQFVANLKIYEKEKSIDGKLHLDYNVTNDFLKDEKDRVKLFSWLNDRVTIEQKSFLKYPSFGIKKVNNYRWNYVEDKSYPCNETRGNILSRLKKIDIEVFDKALIEELWHILYSVEGKIEVEKSLVSFTKKHKEYNLGESFVEAFRKYPKMDKQYGAYSAKAIKKLLPLMRMGELWQEDSIDDNTKTRINNLINGEFDENIRLRVREKTINLVDISSFKGLPLWLVSYVVYNRHSESNETDKWETPNDIDTYLKTFKQHSLRNPIVEQVITETLRTVRDIWKEVGNIDEIHIELGRSLKNSNDIKERISKQNTENENTNFRIKALLTEFANPEYKIENVRPYSYSQQERLRIYEDTILNSEDSIPDNIQDTLKKYNTKDIKKFPSSSEVLKYKLWLEQKYRSPYTGEIIPLSKLFSTEYEIEHIIPQSRYFDDSFNNKVICESEVNKLKDDNLGYEFINKYHGQKVELSYNKVVTVFTTEQYEQFLIDYYSNSNLRIKKQNLLLEDIPEKFIERQLNDTRYISKVVKNLLSNIVRVKDENGNYETEEVSKNLISCSGGITNILKRDWGMNDVWNKIIYTRFERLNAITNSDDFGGFVSKEGRRYFQTAMPLELQKGFNKKRIDHRHHAMDAIIIACASRSHVNYLNNKSALKKSNITRYELQHSLCYKSKPDKYGNYSWIIKKPWETFTQDSYKSLSEIIISYKQNTRVINKSSNYYESYNDENGDLRLDKYGNPKKGRTKQTKGDHLAIRKPLHKETVFGKYELNNETYSSVRKPLDKSFTEKKIEKSIKDDNTKAILLKHLLNNNKDPEIAFSTDGIEDMNNNIISLNSGSKHKPIFKVQVMEVLGNKFAIGSVGNKKYKYVETEKGTNLFFAVYSNEDSERKFITVPLNIVIECQKKSLINKKSWILELDQVISQLYKIDSSYKLSFILSPNQLVYLPTADDLESEILSDKIDINRIYKFVSCTGNEGHFIPHHIASSIVDTTELGANNKAQRAWTNEMIKEICIPLKVDRIGSVVELNRSLK